MPIIMIDKSIFVPSNAILFDQNLCQRILLSNQKGKKVKEWKSCPIKMIRQTNFVRSYAVFVRSYDRWLALWMTLTKRIITGQVHFHNMNRNNLPAGYCPSEQEFWGCAFVSYYQEWWNNQITVLYWQFLPHYRQMLLLAHWQVQVLQPRNDDNWYDLDKVIFFLHYLLILPNQI